MTKAPEMLERVARAILKARFFDIEPEMYSSIDEFWSVISDYMPETLVEARAAIEAMADPTKPMIFFGMDAMTRDDLEPTEDEFRAGFIAAIRAASGNAI